SLLERAPDRGARRQQPLLAHELVERRGPQPRGQRRVREWRGAAARRLRPAGVEQSFHGYRPMISSAASCTCPLVARASPPSAVRSPAKSVNRPPASSTITSGAARS